MGNTPPAFTKEEKQELTSKYQIKPDEMDKILKKFAKCASKGSKTIDRESFTKILKKRYSNAELASKMFDVFDKNKDGVLCVDEFCTLFSLIFGPNNLDMQLRYSFQMIDADGNGKITKQEMTDYISTLTKYSTNTKTLSGVVKTKISNIVEETFFRVDKDNSGTIDIDEYIEGFKAHPDIYHFLNQFDVTK